MPDTAKQHGLTITEAPAPHNVVIDGCAVPVILYNQVRDQAHQTGTFRCIGVLYHQPDDLKPVPGETYDWARSMERASASTRHLRNGLYLDYVLGKTRDELVAAGGCLMILHISPNAEAARCIVGSAEYHFTAGV